MSLTLPVPEAAAYLGVSERTIWRRIRSGSLPTERSGRRLSVRLETSDSPRRVAEAEAGYDPSRLPGIDPLVSVWPYTPEKVAAQRERLRQQRIAAFKEIEALSAQTRPDPDGLTAVDYLREWRDPDWTPDEDDGP